MKKALRFLPLLGLTFFASFASPAGASPYLWCAVTGGGNGGICTFRTLAACREVIADLGGACSPNLAYNRRDAGVTVRRHRALRY